jgi:hypothetical protein
MGCAATRGKEPYEPAPQRLPTPPHLPRCRHHASEADAAALLGYPGVPALAPLCTSRLPPGLHALRLENFEVGPPPSGEGRDGRTVYGRTSLWKPLPAGCLPSLRRLRLDGCRVPGGGVAGAFGSARWLRTLELWGCEAPDSPAQLAAAFPLLAELALLQGSAVGSPVELGGCPHLDLPNAAPSASPTTPTGDTPGPPPPAEAAAQEEAAAAGRPRLAALREGIASMRWLRSLALGSAHSSAECQPGGLQVAHGPLVELLAGLGAGVPPHAQVQQAAAGGSPGAAPAAATAGAGLHHLALKGMSVLMPKGEDSEQVGVMGLTLM